MGIDFYAFTENVAMRRREIKDLDFEEWKKIKEAEGLNEFAYVRESYHGVTHAVPVFAEETYNEQVDEEEDKEKGILRMDNYVSIPAKILRERLPETEAACWRRARDYAKAAARAGDPEPEEETRKYAEGQIEEFRKIVEVAEKEELEGRRVWLYNSY